MTPVVPDLLEPLALSRRHTVLCVDDDPAVLRSLRRLFRKEPYDLVTTERPELVLEWMEQAEVSLVLVDHRMPGLYGYELAAKIRDRSPDTIRVMLTAHPESPLVEYALAGDVDWLVSKPWNDEALRLTVRRLLRSRERSSPPPRRPDETTAPPKDRRGDGNAPPPPVLFPRAVAALIKALGWSVGFLWSRIAGGSP